MGFQHRQMPTLRRISIEDEIEMHLSRVETLMARLDRADSPYEDLEDDDPAGDPLDLYGEAPTSDGTPMLRTRPMYAVDQTSGPVNEREAYAAYRAEELGLVRSPNGGWRK